ncbi:MAG: TIGR03761 family integrating conjugative element protein [Aromatoleum sp.]|jgi:integrating conjugative element protein (TIGR03761 family)|uniref:PFL_4669 family integrating conjugative element protein n=1 Tax=Aromatoleum sp. TaxID=2307007 RepID=UPI002895C564|nr:TIGR03761 family integrating conjugative element protein [Aromatoleum sp.]MDT3671745.1 TIGR03761 family integrating conjugative element protein [Aromatoleum sp.]
MPSDPIASPLPRSSPAPADDQPGLLDPVFPGGTPILFETDDRSPFPDRYSIAREREKLADLIDADDPDPHDPRWARYELYLQRCDTLQQMEAEYRVTAGADATVEPAVATQLRDLGSLVDDGVDTMTLHTKEGFRMFMGRRRDPAGHYNAIPGGKRVASSLKALWALTRNNNPYADWALLRADHRIPELRRALERQSQLFSAELKKRADKGLGFGILKSREPKVLELGFRSPYGYVIAELIVEFDYYVRVVKTLGRKALFSDKEAHDAIRQFTRPMRAAFEEFIRFESWLTKPDLLALSRADFLPGADATAQKRVAAVTGIFGAVPAGIYAGHPISRHSQRRIAISETEKAMLERVAADIAAIDSERGAAGDEATDDGLVD